MNDYDHEDAFKDANLCAGRLVNLSDAIKSVRDKDTASRLIIDCQEKYLKLFEAFICGVEYGRRNPKDMK